jgi:NitT/TauT family transport system substrate-binding protein
VPRALGYFKDENLDVTVEGVAGGSIATQLVLSGHADIAGCGTSAFQTAVKDPEVRLISMVSQNIYRMSVLPGSGLKSLGDLRGKKIGTTDLGGSQYLNGRAMIAAGGLDPDKDVTWVPVGVGAQATQALKSGAVQAYVGFDGAFEVINKNLGQKLAYVPTVFDKLQGTASSWCTTKEILAKKHDLIVGYLRALYKGNIFTATNPAAAVQIHWAAYPSQKPTTGGSDAQIIAQAAEEAKARYVGTTKTADGLPIGSISKEELQKTFDVFTKYNVINAPGVDPTKIVDFSLNKEANDFDQAAVKKDAEAWKPGK